MDILRRAFKEIGYLLGDSGLYKLRAAELTLIRMKMMESVEICT